jgi:stress response protein YsnF
VERTVFALFDDYPTAQRVAGELEREGYDHERISVLAPDPRGEYTVSPQNGSATEEILQCAQLTIPGVGPAAVAGPLVAALAGHNGSGREIVESLTRFGFSRPDATHYYESLRRGHVVVAVETPEDRVARTGASMRKLGARAVTETASITAAQGHGDDAPIQEGLREEVTLPVVEEKLEVGKRQVNRGGVRVHSHIVEQPVQESVHLREERVRVERRPVSRDATEEDLADFKEGSIEIHETVEEAVISKRRRVVEEIVIGRETRERTQTISETVRRTQVDVEPLQPAEGVNGRASNGSDWRRLHESGSRREERFERYEPAYRYGGDLAREERYRHAEWHEVEPHARDAWEKQNTGTWDQFKDAVRSAWEKVKGH